MRKNRADAVHIMYSCAAFVKNGIEVELLTPKVSRKKNKINYEDIFSLYDVDENFTITELNTKIKEGNNNKTSTASLLANKFIYHVLFILSRISDFKNEETIIYSKCYVSVLPYIFLKKVGLIQSKIVFETPFLKDNSYHKFIMSNVDSIVVMTHYVRDFISTKFKIESSKVIKSPVRFQSDYSSSYEWTKKESRLKIEWDEESKYIIYAGKAGANLNRIKVFAEAAKILSNYNFVIVGATEELISEYTENKPENLLIYSFKSYPEYLNFVKAADILVASYEDNFYNRHTLSPGKGGAYLQSGNPVIFTDLPCLRERFTEELVSFVKPDDYNDLVEKIQDIFSNLDTFILRANTAKSFVEERTFTHAAKFIVTELNNKLFFE